MITFHPEPATTYIITHSTLTSPHNTYECGELQFVAIPTIENVVEVHGGIGKVVGVQLNMALQPITVDALPTRH